MRKFKFLSIALILFVGMFFTNQSCQKDFENLDAKNQASQDVQIINNRFTFSSRDALKSEIENLDKKTPDELEIKFKDYYKSGFRSYTPIVNPDDDETINLLSKSILNNSSIMSRSIDEGDEEELILDPYLAALVNDENELVVNDTLYHFTDKGLFYSQVQDSLLLFDYLEESLSTYDDIEIESDRELNGGVTEVSESVFRYIAPIDDDEYYGGGSSGSSGSGTLSNTTTDPIQTVIDNLSNCEGSGNWFQNIFGTSYWCTDYWDSRHRVKTEFWNQKWGIYASCGVLTKSQVRRLQIWWAKSADEIYLGINRILLKYNYPKPTIQYITHPPVAGKQRPIYMYNGNFKVKQDGYGYYYVDTQIDLVDTSLPFFEFEDQDLLNIYIPNVPLLGEYQLNLTTQDITSQANLTKLYKMGIDFLQGFLGSSSKKFAITHQKNENEIEVIYFGERYHNTNDNMLKKRFYQDVNFVISAAWSDGSNSGWHFDIQPANEYFRNYTHYELDFYGLAKRDGVWKGNRLIRN